VEEIIFQLAHNAIHYSEKSSIILRIDVGETISTSTSGTTARVLARPRRPILTLGPFRARSHRFRVWPAALGLKNRQNDPRDKLEGYDGL
jgi:hypothetical protein